MYSERSPRERTQKTLFCNPILPLQLIKSRSESTHLRFKADQLIFHAYCLRQAITALRRGETFYSPAFHEAKRARTKDSQGFTKILSERECTILSLIGNSMSDGEIARELGISPTTAQTHRSHIMRKLGVTNSAKLIQFAIEHGFTRVVSQRNGKAVLS
jgi:DNA-binding NarL/FixJ family response regulator